MTQSHEEARPIDLESFERLTMRLGEALADHEKDPANLYILDSVIKRFELTYELAIRSLRRFLLDQAVSGAEINDMSFAGIVRRGDKEGLLLTGWPGWQAFRDARNETVHTYREEKARAVAQQARDFLPEAQFLLTHLKKRLQSHD